VQEARAVRRRVVLRGPLVQEDSARMPRSSASPHAGPLAPRRAQGCYSISGLRACRRHTSLCKWSFPSLALDSLRSHPPPRELANVMAKLDSTDASRCTAASRALFF